MTFPQSHFIIGKTKAKISTYGNIWGLDMSSVYV